MLDYNFVQCNFVPISVRRHKKGIDRFIHSRLLIALLLFVTVFALTTLGCWCCSFLCFDFFVFIQFQLVGMIEAIKVLEVTHE